MREGECGSMSTVVDILSVDRTQNSAIRKMEYTFRTDGPDMDGIKDG